MAERCCAALRHPQRESDARAFFNLPKGLSVVVCAMLCRSRWRVQSKVENLHMSSNSCPNNGARSCFPVPIGPAREDLKAGHVPCRHSSMLSVAIHRSNLQRGENVEAFGPRHIDLLRGVISLQISCAVSCGNSARRYCPSRSGPFGPGIRAKTSRLPGGS